ncbi:MAG: hypothetical protein ACK5UN_00730 [Planctomycetota bacterium]
MIYHRLIPFSLCLAMIALRLSGPLLAQNETIPNAAPTTIPNAAPTKGEMAGYLLVPHSKVPE